MGCIGSKSREFDKEILKDFTTFYKFMRKKLKAQKFKFKSSDGISLRKRLSACYGISKKIAKVWISLYIDYIMLLAFNLLSSKKDVCIYPPYAIQQVLKIHVADTTNFWDFNDILMFRRGDFPYIPWKLTPQENFEKYQALNCIFDDTKKYLNERLYFNLSLLKSGERKEEAEDIWEEFNLTLMQCEFNLCFFTKEAKENFQKVLVDYPEEIEMESQNPEEIMRVKKVIRELLGIGELIEDKTYIYTPRIQPLKSSNSEDKILEQINKISFSAEFINILAWEQRITTEEAHKWIDEYKKFLFLVQVAGWMTKLSPSEAVDQVRHLHAQFVERYEEDIKDLNKTHFCPVKGNLEEMMKKKTVYSDTLKRYTTYFGSPDEKIWPLAEKRILESGRWATYYFTFAKKCLTNEQKNKVLQKYKERVMERQPNISQQEQQKQKEEDEEANFDAYSCQYDIGVGGNVFLLCNDPFNPFWQLDSDLSNGRGDTQIFDNQSADNHIKDEDKHSGGWWPWGNDGGDTGGDYGGDDGGYDGGGCGGGGD